MLIYTGTKQQFNKDVLSGMIAPKIEREFANRGLSPYTLKLQVSALRHIICGVEKGNLFCR